MSDRSGTEWELGHLYVLEYLATARTAERTEGFPIHPRSGVPVELSYARTMTLSISANN